MHCWQDMQDNIAAAVIAAAVRLELHSRRNWVLAHQAARGFTCGSSRISIAS